MPNLPCERLSLLSCSSTRGASHWLAGFIGFCLFLSTTLVFAWGAAASLQTARRDHTATLLPNGKALVVGGHGSSNGSLASAELYDPVTNAWTAVGTLATARARHTATLLAKGKVPVVAIRASHEALY